MSPGTREPSAAIAWSFLRQGVGPEKIGKNDSDDEHLDQVPGGGRIRNRKAPSRVKK